MEKNSHRSSEPALGEAKLDCCDGIGPRLRQPEEWPGSRLATRTEGLLEN